MYFVANVLLLKEVLCPCRDEVGTERSALPVVACCVPVRLFRPHKDSLWP